VGEDEIPIEKDVAIYIPPKERHQLVNTGDETLKVLWIFSPPGPERDFIEKRMARPS
jgi:mannose-6-phosphate isomerase-like protein (cupin superfamily)